VAIRRRDKIYRIFDAKKFFNEYFLITGLSAFARKTSKTGKNVPKKHKNADFFTMSRGYIL